MKDGIGDLTYKEIKLADLWVDTCLLAMSQLPVAMWFGSLWMKDLKPFFHPGCSE